MKKLNVHSTAYPNGNRTTYTDGMDKPKILPSNHPKVLKMMLERIPKNTFRKPRTLLEEAGVIIQLTSAKLRRQSE